MVKPVEGFREVFGKKAAWRVAIIADCNLTVAGFLPAIELPPHDMTIQACGWGIRHVGVAAGISEGKQANTEEDADGDSENEREYPASVFQWVECGPWMGFRAKDQEGHRLGALTRTPGRNLEDNKPEAG